MKCGRELPGYPYNLKAKLTRCLVAGRRLVFGKWLADFSSHAPLSVCAEGQSANDQIRMLLEKPQPCLIARFGSGEMEATLRGIDVQSKACLPVKILRMMIGEGGAFWWDNSIRAGLVWIVGFFPETDDALNSFSDRVCQDVAEIDLLGSWLPGEKFMARRFAPNMRAVPLNDLCPLWFKYPWTGVLANKKVLMVHSFADTIRAQYGKRRLLFSDPDMLPDFELKTYRTCSSFAGTKTPYKTWFDALTRMCEDISKIDFDVAIIGCGAYGMSIGAFIKRDLGRKAVHLGGNTQLLFGIKGGRWDAWPLFCQLYNEHWCRPFASDTIADFKTVEGGSYW